MKFPYSSATGGVLALALLLAACNSSNTVSGNAATLTELVSTFGNEQFLPRSANEGPAGEDHLVMASLLTETNGNLSPGIAQTWKESSDATTWTFTIADGIKFQNGETVTADDVTFSLLDTFGPAAINDPNSIGANLRVAKKLVAVETTDPHTVQVRFNSPVPYFGIFVSDFLSGSVQGGIFPKAYFQKVGRDGFNKAPIGAGPWKLTQIKSGQSMTFERFDDYYNKARLPQFKQLVVNLVPEQATRVEALIGGSADIIQADTSVQSQISGAGKNVTYSADAQYIYDQWQGCWKITFPCHDLRVRQAMDLALDKKLIMSNLYGASWQDDGWQLAMPGTLGYTAALKPRPQNVDQAKQLLASAGYPDGKGFPTVIIDVIADSASIARLPDFALLVAQEWKTVLNITAEVRVSDFASLDSRQGTPALDGQFYIRDNQARYDGGSLFAAIYGGDPTNPNHLDEDPAITAVVDKMATAIAPADRVTAYSAAYIVARDSEYEIAFGSLSTIWGTASRVHSWQPLPLDGTASGLWTIQVS